MNYIKIIFISFIIIHASFFYAQETDLISTADVAADTTEMIVGNDELENWNKHLEKLKNNWDATTNKPYESWIKDAITIAIDTLRINKELAETLKISFINAIKKQNAELTTETAELISTFNNAIKKELTEPQVEIVEETQKTEPLTTAIKLSTETSLEAQPQIEAPVTEAAPPVETTATETIVEKAEAAKPIEAEMKKEEPIKENLTQKWKNCLSNMQRSTGDLYALINEAIELAQKLRDSEGMSAMVLLQNFTHALEGAAIRRKLLPGEKDDYITYFAQRINIYTPSIAQPINHYQQQKSEFDALQNMEEMQRKLAQQEKAAQSAAREAERQRLATIATQEALRLEAEKRQFTESQQHKLELSRIQAEHHAAAQTIKDLQNTAKQLKDELNKAIKEQKVAAEKSLFTRAKETVTGLIWGPSETQSPEEIIEQKQKQLQQLTKEIENEEEKLFEQKQKMNEKYKKHEDIKARIAHELIGIEAKRQKEREKERQEIIQLKASKDFKKLVVEWHEFLTRLEQNSKSTFEDNDKATKEAINRAIDILKLIPQFTRANVIYKSNGLKQSFINALLIQQKNNENPLNIFINQAQFDNAINIFLDQIENNQPTSQLIQ